MLGDRLLFFLFLLWLIIFGTIVYLILLKIGVIEFLALLLVLRVWVNTLCLEFGTTLLFSHDFRIGHFLIGLILTTFLSLRFFSIASLSSRSVNFTLVSPRHFILININESFPIKNSQKATSTLELHLKIKSSVTFTQFDRNKLKIKQPRAIRPP